MLCRTDDRSVASRMEMHVRQAFLRHTKQRSFEIGRETSNILVEQQFHVNPAKLGETANKPLKCGNKT